MMYAKLVDGAIYPAVPVIVPNENFIFKPTEEQLIASGYLPIRHTTAPEAKVGFKRSFKWVQTDGELVQEWELHKEQRKQSTFETARMLTIQTADDNTALRMKQFYPEWAENTAYEVGHKVQYGGKLWRVVQAHTAQIGWEPVNVPSLWTEVCETHAGTLEDPIPYDGNMALENGKHYSQYSAIYLCNRDTINPVHNKLAELVGLYVVEV